MENKNFISIYFEDEEPLLKAVRKIMASDLNILDVLTPFPVHGLDKALKMKPSRIPIVGFVFGSIGAMVGFGFQAWVFGVDYPLVIGGKPFIPVPSFIPVTFEITVLFAALSMVAAFLIKSKLKPSKKIDIQDVRITDDRFVILVETNDANSKQNVEEVLGEITPIEIR